MMTGSRPEGAAAGFPFSARDAPSLPLGGSGLPPPRKPAGEREVFLYLFHFFCYNN